MHIIPVIDISQGRVVHARYGQRDSYRPLRSRLTDSARPPAVLDGLLQVSGFGTVYIADLDAIRGCGDNYPEVAALRQTYPDVHFWIDAGIGPDGHYPPHLSLPGTSPVLGSENPVPMPHLQRLLTAPEPPVLSLDLQVEDQGFPWLELLPCWPSRIIVMCLYRVGSGRGVDLDCLQRVQGLTEAGHHQLYAAGGIRDSRDLERLCMMGVQGCLLASALHEGRLGSGELSAMAGIAR